jgi:serine/threonine-protein kinase HipA
MNGAYVGAWSLGTNGPDTLQYDPEWARSEQGRPLSLSLPFMPGNLPHRGPHVRAWFENLLPDSKDIRDRMARHYRTASPDAFDLLSEAGRDCAGALQILPMGMASSGVAPLEADPLTDTQVAALLRATTTPQVMGLAGSDTDLRISIAGAQEKTALLQMDGQWYLPHGATPTTHILKLPLGLIGGMKLDMRHSVENEWLCARILAAYGLPVAACQPFSFEDMKVLAVERFDRTWWVASQGDRRLVRLPQEDLCQAKGMPPTAKYEADGGPGIDAIFQLLEGSLAREQDRRVFFQAQVLFWMLCATDGHAKNFSLFIRPGGRYQLTPLYDVLSAYPVLGEGPSKISPRKAKLAMAVRTKNAHWKMKDILRRHWLELGTRHGVVTADGRPAQAVLGDLVARTPEALALVRAQLPPGFPEEVAGSILAGVETAAARLAA